MTFRIRRPKPLRRPAVTRWNGMPCACARVLVTIGAPPDHDVPLAWWKGLEGTERRAVMVVLAGQPPFFLDDENGEGWSKVTVARGMPWHGHRAIWPANVLRDLTPAEYPPPFTIPSLEEQFAQRRAAEERIAAWRAAQAEVLNREPPPDALETDNPA